MMFVCVCAAIGVPCEEDKRQWCWAPVCYESVEEGHTERFATLLCVVM